MGRSARIVADIFAFSACKAATIAYQNGGIIREECGVVRHAVIYHIRSAIAIKTRSFK